MLNGHDNSKRRQTTKGQIAMVAAMGFATAAAVNPEDGKRGRIAPWRCSSASAGSVVRLCRPVPRGRRLCRAPHPRRRSRAGQMGGPGFRDLLHLAPKAGHDAAAWVVERGRATGAEHIAVVDNRTGEIVHAGTKGLTGNFWLDFVSAPAERDAYTIHHTQAARRYPPRIFGYWPTQVSGRCTRTTATLRGFPPGLTPTARTVANAPKNIKASKEVYAEADKRTQTLLQWLADQDKITPEQGHHFWYDATNRFLHADGIIDYLSSQPLPEPIRTTRRTELRKSGHVDARYAQSVHPEERNAGLPPGVREDQGSRPPREAMERCGDTWPNRAQGKRWQNGRPPRPRRQRRLWPVRRLAG